MSALRFSVLISSYNYQDYVLETVASALAQTHAPHEVIVVDDGSTDQSVARLQAAFAHEPKVKILVQANAGQLAAWIHGLAHSTGDCIALLDSDDLWETGYLAAMAETFERKPDTDFVFCNMALFGVREGLMLNRPWHRQDRDLGTSVLLGHFHPRWQGVATSGNVLRRTLMQQLLDLPQDMVLQWKSRPDDCLFYGADILGARKVYVSKPWARHREHGSNALLADQGSALKRMKYEFRKERMLAYYRQKVGVGPRLLNLAKPEFLTKSHPTGTECWLYLCMLMRSPQRISRKWGQAVSILRHYLRG